MAGILEGPSALAAILTPIEPSGAIDAARLARHALWILDEGCDGIALFGSTGEASSFSVGERKAALEAVQAKGVPAGEIVVGTGCTSLADAVDVGRHAVSCGCAGLLVIPPYFFKPVDDDGLFSFYAALVEGVNDPRLRILLYHFPALSGVPLSLSLVARLRQVFPATIIGLKDSSGDLANMRTLLAADPGLAVFTGDDHLLRPLLRMGGAGSITAGGNLWPHTLARLRDSYAEPDAVSEDAQQLTEQVWRNCLLQLPVTEALKSLFAAATGDEAWRNLRPPLVPIADADLAVLRDAACRAGLVFWPGMLRAIGTDGCATKGQG